MTFCKESVQGKNHYSDENIEKFRYNPYRRQNRIDCDKSYVNNEVLPFPRHIIVETSSYCNLKCSFCCREVMTRPQANMTLETFKKVADECAQGGVHSLSLYCLGEPMLNKDLPEMISYAKGRGIPYVDVSTNGMFDLLPLLGTGLDELIVSLDGFQETHESLRPGSEYRKIVSHLEQFTWAMKTHKHRKPIIRAQMIDLPLTHSQIEEFVKFWSEKVDVVYIKNLEVFSQNLGSTNLDQEKIDKRLKERKPCKQLYFVLTVNSNGDIAVCCHDPKGYSVTGNIKDMTLKQSWDSIKDARERHRNGDYSDFGGLCLGCVDFQW